jgi:Bacterial SH3 domain
MFQDCHVWTTAMSQVHRWRISVLALALAALAAAPAGAGPGDIHRVVNADLVNLRAGPSEESSVRGTLERGGEVIELTRRDDWLGVRVLRTGEEGWIFEQLLEPVALSTLGTAGAAPIEDVGFLRLSESFNRLIRSIGADLGYPVIHEVQQPEADLLRVVPSSNWLINGSREAHLMAAAAIYEMWKNHQNGAPVRLVMADDAGHDYITIVDDETGPNLSIGLPPRG